MQPSFLDEIARILHQEYQDQLHEVTLIVPNKRAVVFLRQSLAKVYNKIIWSPDILAVQQFFRKAAGVSFPEPLAMVLELYDTYRQEARKNDPTWDEPLESFFSWGEMLLSDFDEVDKYMIPAEQLFANIHDLREIDAFFSLTDEDREALQRLWQAVKGNRSDRQQMEERFLNLWSLMLPVYTAFREKLQDRGLAYDGMAYRLMAERIQQGENVFAGRKLIFIGFNALLKTEEVIMEQLLATRQATVFWDVHPWYFRQDRETPLLGKEPGKFISAYHSKWAEAGLDSRVIVAPEREQTIHLVGAPQHIGQTRYLGLELNRLLASHKNPSTIDWAKQAVVLADEKLLFPSLEVLPEPATFPNVTMGYPLQQTHIFHLIDIIIELLKNRQAHPEYVWNMGHQDVRRLLLHPYLQEMFPEGQEVLQSMAKGNLLVLPAREILQSGYPTLIKTIFSAPAKTEQLENVEAVLGYFDQILEMLMQEMSGKLDLEFLLKLRESLTILGNTLTEYHTHIRTDALGRLLKQALRGIRIPFEGEPLKGLQVMGFLETRGLDFERIWILGANEGLLPDTSTGNSFVPYLLRRAFGMPTFEEKDAIYAYHFYRFLQRSAEVYLVYNRVVADGANAREVSRFIQQIRFFLSEADHVKVIEHQANAPALVQTERSIRISMTEAIRQHLQRRFGDTSAISPSALNTYRACSLKFYFRYVAELKEPETVDTQLPSNLFGTLLHRVLELAYQAMGLETELSAAQILQQIDHLDEYLTAASKQESLSPEYLLQGENLLKRRALLNQAAELLRQDAERAPFTVLGTEKNLHYPGYLDAGGLSFRLKGQVDRIDIAGNQARIIDYKTGKIDLAGSNKLDSLAWEEVLTASGKDQLVQGMSYAMLFQSHHPEFKSMQVGFYGLRKPSSWIQFLNSGQAVTTAQIRAFETGLLSCLERLASEDFVQTDDRKTCDYCAYAGICQRDGG